MQRGNDQDEDDRSETETSPESDERVARLQHDMAVAHNSGDDPEPDARDDPPVS